MRGRRQIPAFGNWDYSDELPITQHFESADGELVKLEAVAAPAKLVVCQKKVRGGIILHAHLRQHYAVCSFQASKGGGEKGKQRACEARVAAERMPRRAPKAVDEDLYKIPPELLCRKPKRVS